MELPIIVIYYVCIQDIVGVQVHCPGFECIGIQCNETKPAISIYIPMQTNYAFDLQSFRQKTPQ